MMISEFLRNQVEYRIADQELQIQIHHIDVNLEEPENEDHERD